MVQFICLFFPGIISVMIIEKKLKRKINHRQFFSYYIIFTLIINLFAFIILSILYTPLIISPEIFNSRFAAKYILLLFFLAVISAYSIIAIEYIKYHCTLKLWHQKIDKEEKNNYRDVIKNIIFIILLFLISFLFFCVKWVYSTFSFLSIEELIFHLTVPMEGVGKEMVINFLMKVIFPSFLIIIFYFVFTGIYYFQGIAKVDIKINNKLKSISILPIKFIKEKIVPIIIVLFVSVVIYSINKFGLKEIKKYLFTYSKFIEDNYSDTKNIKLIFPEKKRNLIFIYMESMEVTSLSKELGGASNVNLIPELYEIAQENVNFSDSEMVGGALQVPGTGWTVSAMIAQTTGLPFKLPIQGNSYTSYNSFLPGITSLGDILYENGYNQTLILGSDARFAGRDQYYKTHGNQKILDIFTAYEDKIIPENYYVWWGFDDRYLYKYAKKELTRLSKEKEPFSLTLLTVDTHHIGGYVCPLCKDEYKEQMSNVISCASRQIADFIDWLKHQDYYDNTTIVIQGDHLSMDSIYYKYIDYEYIRRTINVFINPTPTNTDSQKNIKNRIFSTLDIFPTTLASLGVEINGNKLGLGTNLFSEEKTILEIYGKDQVNKELGKRSKFYNKFYK